MKNDYYSGTYIPGIVKWGKITLLLGIFAGFLPALVMAFRGYMPPVSAIIAGTLMQISVSGAFYIVEPISYFPILGIPGTYLTFLSGNTSNMRVPCSSVAQEAAGVEMGTEEGSIISTIGIATSILVNVVILTVGAVAGSVILNILPAPVKEALNFLLPALFGAVFGQVCRNTSQTGRGGCHHRHRNELAHEAGLLKLHTGQPILCGYSGSCIWLHLRRQASLQERASG